MHPHVPEITAFTQRLRPIVKAAAAELGVDVGDTIECLMARHGHGDGLGFHQDGVQGAFPHRVLSFVYYRRFGNYSGGNLQRIIDNEITDYFPEDDSLVIFDSRILHGVSPVCCDSPANWLDGRFSLVGWVAPPRFVVPKAVDHGSDHGERVTQWGAQGSFFYSPSKLSSTA